MNRTFIQTIMNGFSRGSMLLLLALTASSTLLARSTPAQSVYQIEVELASKDASLSEVFKEIEDKTIFAFMYDNHVDLKRRVKIREERNLGKILELLSRQGHVQFKQINTVLVVRAAPKVAAPGILYGTVYDGQTKDPLPGALIRVKNSSLGTVTALNGTYSLRLPVGTHEVEVSYLGFASGVQTVEITDGEKKTWDVELVPDARQLDDVVVTGILQGQQKALNQQKSADNIKNIVSADQIGRFPDPNVAEALQRLPGVNIERDQGEGRYVLVRGLAPQFTNISINGEQIPSPEAGVRFVALDAIPADQLASIEVAKAITPDMDGDAIGGSVNLITRTAEKETPTVSASALLGYNNLRSTPNFQGSLEVGQRFLDNKLGVMLNGSYYESDRGSHNWERDDSEMELRDYELIRTRLGLSSTVDYRFSDQSEIYFRSLYNRFTDREWRRRYVLVPNVDESPFESNEIERLTKDRLEKQIVSSYNLGGRHQFTGLNLDYEIAYAEAVQDTPFDLEVGSVGEVDQLSIDFDTQPEFPVFRVDGELNNNPDNIYLDNSIYEFDELTSGNTYAEDINKTAKINLGIPFYAGSHEGLVKFGGKVRLKEKRFDVVENVFGWAGGDVSFNGQEGDYTLEKYEGGLVDNNFLGGRYLLRANADVDKVVSHFNANRDGYELDVEGKLAAEAVESYTATEDVYAGYAMAKVQLDKLMLLGGFRYEKTNVAYTFNEVIYNFDGDLEEIVPRSGSTDYGFFLPQLHARYRVDANTNLRAAVTRSYARPNFEDIVPSQEIELSAREGTIGNPLLKPVSATNIDVMAERYFGTVGILSAGVFYKRLDDFIFNRRIETDNYPGAEGIALQLTQAQNGENASLFGVEFAYQQNLTFLPGFAKGFSVYANYTYTHSNASIQSREGNAGTEDIRLPGQARSVGNFSIGYDLARLNFRISANFNGAYLTEVGGDASEDFFVKERVQFDATATYAVHPKLRLFAEFLNITDQPFEVYQDEENQYVQREFYSWWARAGIKFDF